MENTDNNENNLISFIDKSETQVMHTKSDNVEIVNGTDTSDAINKLISSFMKRYQEGLETKMKGSSYIFERVDLLEYDLHKISLNRGSSYIVPPKWLKYKGVIKILKILKIISASNMQ